MKFPKFSSNPNRTVFGAHTRGTLYAVILTLVSVLIFALLVKVFGMSSGAIKPITQIIKVVSIFIGVLVVLRTVEKRAWLHGAILGLVYTVLAFFIFSIIDKNFSITSGLLIDIILAIVIGIISAMLLRMRKRAAQ